MCGRGGFGVASSAPVGPACRLKHLVLVPSTERRDHDYAVPPVASGETVCQGHGYSESECWALGNGCCQWDPTTNPADLGWPAAPGTSTGACWSNVGDSPCHGYGSGFGEGSYGYGYGYGFCFGGSISQDAIMIIQEHEQLDYDGDGCWSRAEFAIVGPGGPTFESIDSLSGAANNCISLEDVLEFIIGLQESMQQDQEYYDQLNEYYSQQFFPKAPMCVLYAGYGGTDDGKLEQCKAACAESSHCCNDDIGSGSNQKLSCLQACMVRVRGTDQSTCNTYCFKDGCEQQINGFNYELCGTCWDVPDHGGYNSYQDGECSHQYGSDQQTCLDGCAVPVEDFVNRPTTRAQCTSDGHQWLSPRRFEEGRWNTEASCTAGVCSSAPWDWELAKKPGKCEQLGGLCSRECKACEPWYGETTQLCVVDITSESECWSKNLEFQDGVCYTTDPNHEECSSARRVSCRDLGDQGCMRAGWESDKFYNGELGLRCYTNNNARCPDKDACESGGSCNDWMYESWYYDTQETSVTCRIPFKTGMCLLSLTRVVQQTPSIRPMLPVLATLLNKHNPPFTPCCLYV